MTRHSSTEQDRKMIEALRNGPVSSVEAAQTLDIVQPPSTIRRLRKKVTKSAPIGRISPLSPADRHTAWPSTSSCAKRRNPERPGVPLSLEIPRRPPVSF